MPEDLKVDCHECKDLEFARNLAAQMKEGYGRHNSRRDFRDYRLGGFDLNYGEHQQARVIGRIGDNALRERWQECEIGDAVPEAKMEHGMELHVIAGVNFIDKILPKPIRAPIFPDGEPVSVWEQNCERRSFERVCFRVRTQGDCTWRDEYVWKRIE